MFDFKTICAAAVFALATPLTATAATSLLESITIDFGTGAGQESRVGVVGANIVGSDRVFVEDANKNADSLRPNFDFVTDLSTKTIDRFVITLQIAGVSDITPELGSDGLPLSGADPVGELWFAEVRGSSGGPTNSFYKRLPGSVAAGATPGSIFSFELSAANDGGEFGSDRTNGTPNNAFATSVAQDRIRLRFREESALADGFELLSATVDVYEVAAPVPLPASGLLLLGAVGGMAAWKRRKAA